MMKELMIVIVVAACTSLASVIFTNPYKDVEKYLEANVDSTDSQVVIGEAINYLRTHKIVGGGALRVANLLKGIEQVRADIVRCSYDEYINHVALYENLMEGLEKTNGKLNKAVRDVYAEHYEKCAPKVTRVLSGIIEANYRYGKDVCTPIEINKRRAELEPKCKSFKESKKENWETDCLLQVPISDFLKVYIEPLRDQVKSLYPEGILMERFMIGVTVETIVNNCSLIGTSNLKMLNALLDETDIVGKYHEEVGTKIKEFQLENEFCIRLTTFKNSKLVDAIAKYNNGNIM